MSEEKYCLNVGGEKTYITKKEWDNMFKNVKGLKYECEKSHLIMSELEKLGFKIVKSYTHDDWTTQRRKKGCLTVETTYKVKTGQFEDQTVQVDDGEWRNFLPRELAVLDEILNK